MNVLIVIYVNYRLHLLLGVHLVVCRSYVEVGQNIKPTLSNIGLDAQFDVKCSLE